MTAFRCPSAAAFHRAGAGPGLCG